MFKKVHESVWVYDIEWVPDVSAGRVLYGVDDSALSEDEIMAIMWRNGGATDENPTPFLKTVMCRIVSIAIVRRRATRRGISVDLLSLPRRASAAEETDEAAILSTFLHALGKRCPQLVGYNSADSDLKILIQRAVVNGLTAAGFCRRPDKPWEGIDYFARNSEWNIDLMKILGGWGKSTPSLHQIATLSGIPGKLGVDGGDVAAMWLRGEHQRIVDYNEWDAVTTYLLWLRVAHFAGKFTTEEYDIEQNRVREMLRRESEENDKAHLSEYLFEWDRLLELTGGVPDRSTARKLNTIVTN